VPADSRLTFPAPDRYVLQGRVFCSETGCAIPLRLDTTEARRAIERRGFVIVEPLGAGASSIIYHVRDRRTGEAFALKRVAKANESETKWMEHVEHEYEVGHQMDHPYLRRALRIDYYKQFLKVVEIQVLLELVEGVALDQKHDYGMDALIVIFAKVARGLGHMHKMGWVHTDMKPSNVLVGADGLVKIVDFGQACRMDSRKERVQGTVDFIAPEQVDKQPLDRRTDVFNLGATMYWVLTGRNIPTVARERMAHETQQLVRRDRIASASALNPEVPQALSNLIIDCIQDDKNARPQHTEQVFARLRAASRFLQTDEHARNGKNDLA
jgi:serine/threonine-protein kinase